MKYSTQLIRCVALFCLLILTYSGCAKQTLVKEPDVARAWTCNEIADKAMERGAYETGIRLHHEIVNKSPDNGLAWYHLGYAYGQIGDHLTEVGYYERAEATGYREEGLFFNLGMAYGELDQVKESIGAFKKAIAINPDSADNHFGLGLAYQRASDYPHSEEAFLQAVRLNPDYVEARLSLSMLYTAMGKNEEAAVQLHKILEIDPTHFDARQLLRQLDQTR
jgi:tetratricopeptide (TPR) repeat protein